MRWWRDRFPFLPAAFCLSLPAAFCIFLWTSERGLELFGGIGLVFLYASLRLLMYSSRLPKGEGGDAILAEERHHALWVNLFGLLIVAAAVAWVYANMNRHITGPLASFPVIFTFPVAALCLARYARRRAPAVLHRREEIRKKAEQERSEQQRKAAELALANEAIRRLREEDARAAAAEEERRRDEKRQRDEEAALRSGAEQELRREKAEAAQLVESFYTDHTELLAETFPPARLRAELRVRIPPSAGVDEAWAAARDLIRELQAMAGEEKKRRATHRLPVNRPPGAGPDLSNV